MKTLRRILTGLAFASLAVVVLVILVVRGSGTFFDENQAFVERFTHDLSERWEVDDVYDRATAPFISSIQSPEGRRLIAGLESLGELETLYDFELDSYKVTPSGTTGVIVAKARFENANALVSVTLVKGDGEVKVQGFNLVPAHPVENPFREA